MEYKKEKNKKFFSGFTVIELLLTLSIIAVVLSLSLLFYGNIRQKARDVQRTKDIEQIQTALKLYFYNESSYPETLNFGHSLMGSTSSTTYMAVIPNNPQPRNDNNCNDSNYTYELSEDKTDYKLGYCLSTSAGTSSSGQKCATSKGIIDGPCPETCSSWTYSDWGTCSVEGQQSRSIITSTPENCIGGNPVLSQPCSPSCLLWTYSDWTTCTDGQQTRSVISSLPENCIGGNPTLSQSCTLSCSSWTYSDWTACVGGQQSRTILTSSPEGCSGGSPVLTQSCTPTCSSWTYSDWGTCSQAGEQTRSIVTSSPEGCSGGSPVLTQSCTPPFICGTSQLSISSIAGHTCNTGAPDYDTCAYNTVQIGSQCWMNQNLNIGSIINVSSNQSNNSSLEKYCYDPDGYLSDYTYCQSDGALYQWSETMQFPFACNNSVFASFASNCGTGNTYTSNANNQGICPSGWHVPTHDDWTTLERAVCTSGSCTTSFPYNYVTAGWLGTDEGTKLKVGGSSGFNAMLTGGSGYGSFSGRGSNAYLWTSTAINNQWDAWYRYLYSTETGVRRTSYDRLDGHSVRCVKN